jgi:LysR family nitrogen assimilation transcriptional regulator
VDIRQLRYFIAIAESGSFSRAAEQVHVAQPALSQHVQAMEASFGVTLLQRHPRGITLTEAGQRLLERARTIDGQFAELSDYIRGEAMPSGEVRFGMPGTISEQLGVPLIEAGHRFYPNVRIRISEAMSGFVLDWLRDGTIDLAMLYDVKDGNGLKLNHALTEEICLFAVPGTVSSPTGILVNLADALTLPLVLPDPSHGLRDLIDAEAHKIGKRVEAAIEIDAYRQIKQLVARGTGFGMLPATAIRQETHNGTFNSWQITQPALMRRIYLGHLAGRPVSTAGKAIGQLSWRLLKELVQSGGWTAAWENNDDLQLY